MKPGSSVKLCILVSNHMGKPIYYKIVYRVATPDALPSSSAPSPAKALLEWRGVLGDDRNATIPVEAPLPAEAMPRNATRVSLVFELWVYERGTGWVYTGQWVYIHVRVASLESLGAQG